MGSIKLTATAIEKMPTPATRKDVYDGEVPGLVLRLLRNRSLSGVLCPPAPTRNNPSHIHQGGAGSDQGDSDQQQVAAA